MKPHLYIQTTKYLPQMVANTDEVEFLVIDLFCGAGGTSTGFINANGKALVIACINHDAKAIESHWLNNPEVLHFEEDIRTVELSPLVALLKQYKAIYPNAKTILWASLECTNFSKAKGGQPRDADSRTLAEHLYRYVSWLNPDYIQIENVVEFMSWGPLDENGKPISRKSGSEWLRWRHHINAYGYYDEWRELNSADFGAYTSRNRLFGCFAKDGTIADEKRLPIAWPQSTHAKKPIDNGLFGNVKKWMPVKDVLDLEDEGISIFNRKKCLSDKTLKVIYNGIVKESKNTENTFLFKYYGNGDNLNSIDSPAGTIPTKDRFAKIKLILRQYKSGYTHSIEQPLGAIPTVPKADVLTFIVNKSHGGHTMGTNQPSAVIVARQDKAPLYLAYVDFGKELNLDFSNFLNDYDNQFLNDLEIYGPQLEKSIRISLIELMYSLGISDIKMRMLKVLELIFIQGLLDKSGNPIKLCGNQTDQKKFIGNSVVPQVVTAWCIAMAERIREWRNAA